jgi:hypothetical protein
MGWWPKTGPMSRVGSGENVLKLWSLPGGKTEGS